MLHSAYDMSSATLRYQYAPQQDVIEFTPPDFVLVKYGTITINEEDNTKETRWAQEVLNEIKRHAPHGNLKILMDFRTIDSGEFNSHESNKMYREMLHDDAISKVAVFGLPHGWALLIDLLRTFVPHKLKTFPSEDEARTWLYAADR